jgi:thiol-disulfide isomerase/thioredoxin
MSRKISLGLVVAAIALLASCSPKNSELQPKRTVIAGKVENMLENATVIQVNFCDPLSDERRFAQDLTVSDGTFHVTHDYVFAQNITLRYDRSFINVYVVPGDSIFVTIDASKLQQHPDDAVIFSGDNIEICAQLFRWTDYAYNKIPIPDFNPTAAPAEYLSIVEQFFNAVQDTIAVYAQHNEMNDFVKWWAFIDYKFIAANYMDYTDGKSRWHVFTDSIFDIYNEQNFQTMYFDAHLHACVNALVAGNEEIRDLLNKGKYKSAFHALMKELSEKAPEGTVRDMMLYHFAHRMMEEMPELYDSIPELKSFFSQPVFYKKIRSFAREKLAHAKKPVPLTGKTMKGIVYFDAKAQQVTSLPEIEVLPYLVERYKNKVMYIDVWATWCGPCREEMKYMPELHKYFTGKEVIFVNLCLQSTAENWLNTINVLSIKGENYYLDNNATVFFMGMHNLSGFPTYMLIDRNGQLHASVARPSDTQSVIKQIEACLSE